MIDPDEQNKGGASFWGATVALCLLVLYVASPGPMIMLFKHGYHGGARWLGLFYAPLVFVVNNGPPQVTKPYEEYLDWWASL